MHRNKSVDVHQFAMVPRAEIPRSSFNRQFTHKTTMDAGLLVPILVDEVIPGDSFRVGATIFARMSTPLFPIMDNLHLDTFYFFVPTRVLWTNFVKQQGEQDTPGDSIDYVTPTLTSPADGYPALSIFDYMGLPTVGQIESGKTVTHNVLPLRAYNKIIKDWFQDENLVAPPAIRKGDSGDLVADFVLRRRGKRHDYFTSCLPFMQKGEPVPLPVGTSAPVFSNANPAGVPKFAQATDPSESNQFISQAEGGSKSVRYPGIGSDAVLQWAAGIDQGLYADLSQATGATINMLRTSFQIQKLLERDARGGTRYTEHLRASWGVVSPDFRLQRAEYLGGGTTSVNINPVAQTSGTGAYTGTPQGNLAAFGTSLGSSGFTGHFTEHGYVIGLACVRADLTYQQGLRRMWSRSTRYDHYIPVFAYLGEQAVLQKEIYVTGDPAKDDTVFGYQERWADYRYFPSMITGLFRSTNPTPLDAWHLSQKFTAPPTLNESFISENPPMERVLAVGAEAAGQHFIVDSFFDMKCTRLMPMYSVPGLIDHL